jgi:signal transduction histidine kinase
MADLLIKHLRSKTEEHSSLRSLYSQWDFDEKLIPKALQTISNLFPHYSRHDDSHSKQILVNIERLLGNNLGLLTATDTWLILESAYWHDIGMVVPQSDLQEAIDDPEFKDFVQSIRGQPHHDLHSFALSFQLNADATWLLASNTPIDTVSRFREFMAEWFRRKHPARAERIVRAPLNTIGITSPRTELIPARLFSLLGRICHMHGAPFRDLLAENGLPFREAGLAQDDCHPRFVACLLRIGDLLDLDDNRFCPVMQRIAGEARSTTSKAHEDKHAAIRHLRIDQERIEVTAECQTINGYLETFHWFDWLKREVQDQMSNWRDIVPNRELGLLPMLGPLSVRLGGNLQILKDGERPGFSIDAGKAIELLQGNNLYDSKFVCARELLQNAADATLLRIWLTRNKEEEASGWETPDHAAFQKPLADATVSVELTEWRPPPESTDVKSSWTLTIKDSGTGISRSDLEHMLKIGGSQRNIQRQREISRMPEWMKPSGAFGIGLQSAFMLCNEISVLTKSVFTNEILDVTMYSPTGPKEGLVVLRMLPDDISMSHGTTIELKFELDKFAKSWTIPIRNEDSIVSRLISSLDPVLDTSFPYEAALLADQVAEFGRHSLVPIQGTLASLQQQFDINGEMEELKNEDTQNPWRFIKIGQDVGRIQYEPTIRAHHSSSVTTLYRGQQFESKNLYIPHVRIAIDIMSGTAGKWLNFNRDKVAPDAHNELRQTILTTLEQAVRDDLGSASDRSLLTAEKRGVYSLFLKAMELTEGGTWTELANKLGDAWLDVQTQDGKKRFRSFFERSEWTIGEEPSGDAPPLPDCDLLVSGSSSDLTLDVILTEWDKTPGNTIMTVGPKHIHDPSSVFVGPETIAARRQRELIERAMLKTHFSLTNGPQQLWDNSALAAGLVQALSVWGGNRRYVLCVDDRWSLLTLQPTTKIVARHLLSILSPSRNHILLPFLFRGNPTKEGIEVEATVEQIDTLSQWTHSRLRSPVSKDAIRQAYQELIAFIDYEIMKPTIFWDRWKRARGVTANEDD